MRFLSFFRPELHLESAEKHLKAAQKRLQAADTHALNEHDSRTSRIDALSAQITREQDRVNELLKLRIHGAELFSAIENLLG